MYHHPSPAGIPGTPFNIMENDMNNICAQVRAIYRDTPTEFAARMGLTVESVRRWEREGIPNVSSVVALFNAAQRGTFPAVPPRFALEVEAMTDAEIVQYLLTGYGDTMARFAERIGVNRNTVENWANGIYKNSKAARRLLRHVMEHPEEFSDLPAAFVRQNG
jgi:DNA-binding transcriptional regulator YiaG